MNDLKLCSHTHDDGRPCQAIAVHQSPFCYFHRKLHQPSALPGDRHYQPPFFDSHASLQIAATHLYQAFLAGKLDLKPVTVMLNLLRLASKELTAAERQRRQEEREQKQAARQQPIAERKPNAEKLDKPQSPAKSAAANVGQAVLPVGPSEAPLAGKLPQPAAYKGERIVDPYGCLAHLKEASAR